MSQNDKHFKLYRQSIEYTLLVGFYFVFGVILNHNWKQYAVFLTPSLLYALCYRQKCVNTLTMFKRDAKGLYQEDKLH